MSLRTICQSAAVMIGLQPADTWAGNSDLVAQELVTWVNEAQQRIAELEDEWQSLVRDFSADVTGEEEQTIPLPGDLSRIIPDSIYLANPRTPVAGPLTAAEWVQLRQTIGNITPSFTISGGNLLLRTATGGGPLVLRYVAQIVPLLSDTQVSAFGGGASPQALPPAEMERAIMLGAVALYRDAKGLPAQSAAIQYTATISALRARNLPTAGLSMAGGVRTRPAGLNVRVASVSAGPFVLDGSLLL